MVELSDHHKSVLECNSRPIVHLRKQIQDRRFGLIFGAGISKSFGLSTWTELVEMISKDPEVQGENILKIVPPRAGSPYKTEMLFEHFKDRSYKKANPKEHHTRLLDFRIAADWREMVRKHLYSGIKGDLGKALHTHPYIKQYLPLIQRSHMTVTYNFDDFIEQCFLESRSEGEPSGRGFESVTNPWSQFRRTEAVIYHANGVMPQNPLETPSDRFVFSEASFAEQLMGIFAGDQTALLNHFSKNTCLLIGLSLEDETLRNILIQSAKSCPGNFHYYVHHLKDDECLDDEKQRAITLANFKVYNLITLFLTDEGISTLGELIDVERFPRDQFCDFACVHNIPVQFRFYITGPMGVGKTTTINLFRSLYVLDEWLDERPYVLAKDWEGLPDDEKEEADSWIISQFQQKNDILRNEREGIFILDRGPLDPISFTHDEEWPSKAERLLTAICPGHCNWEVEDGRVILLSGDGNELALRMVITQRKGYTAEKLEKNEHRLGTAYGSTGVINFDTHGLLPYDIARRIAEIVHLEDYRPICNLHQRLQLIVKDGINATK